MMKPLRSFWTLAAVALAGLCGFAGDALAGDAVRILVETPGNLDSLEPGQAIDVQVVGLDGSGTRVAFGDFRVEVSPADGSFSLIEAPYRYRYVAPAQIDAPRTVPLRAWLTRRPEVSGTATVRIAPRRTYTKLELRGPSVAEFGSTVTIDVFGVRADGTTERVTNQALVVVVEGPGAVETVSPGVQRYIAPRRPELRSSRSTARVLASLERYPSVQGDLTITMSRDRGTDPTTPPTAPAGGNASRLAIELPQGVTSVEAGQSLDLQVTALDAAGARVSVGDRRLEVSVTEGEIALVTAPDRFRYTAPQDLDGATSVQFRAWLKRTPDVAGSTTIPLLGKRPFERLVVRGAATVAAGSSIDVEVLGVRPDGNAVPLRDHPVVVTVDGPGTIARVGSGAGTNLYRYTAPERSGFRDGGKAVRLVATLERYPAVVGEMSVVIGRDDPKGPPNGDGSRSRLELRGAANVQLGTTSEIQVLVSRRDGAAVPVTDQRISVTLEGPGAITQTSPGVFRYTAPPRADAPSAGRTVRVVATIERERSAAGELSFVLTADPVWDGDDEDVAGVLWPSGNVRLLVWRTKPSSADEWPRKASELPAAGQPLVTTGGFVRLRIQPERADIRKIELEWYVEGRAGAIVRVDDADPAGRLRIVKNKLGRTHAIVETEIPEGGKPLVLSLLMTTASGEILKEEFHVQRAVVVKR